MNETVRQLGELLLSSIPTIIFLLIVWVAYRMIVHKRLEQVLGERYRLICGSLASGGGGGLPGLRVTLARQI